MLQELLDTVGEGFGRRYPGTLRFHYQLPTEAPQPVQVMWRDQIRGGREPYFKNFGLVSE